MLPESKKRKAYKDKWYQDNKERVLQQRKEYYQQHPEALESYRIWKNSWYATNKDRLKTQRKAYRMANPDKVRAQRRVQVARKRGEAKAFMALLKEERGGKCEICGYSKCYAALDWHHINPEEKEISTHDMRRTHSKSRIAAEVAKCRLLCANCHRELHQKDNSATT